MRQFWVHKFVCAKCGHFLEIKYIKDVDHHADYAKGEPTGANMVESYIAVEPCTECKKSLDDIKHALSTISRWQQL